MFSTQPMNSTPKKFLIKIFASWIICVFGSTSIFPAHLSYAQLISNISLNLPAPGALLPLSNGFTPANIRGITIHPENPLLFDFIVQLGDSGLEGDSLKEESRRLIKYFLAGLTVPEDQMWVNLSPYEEDRLISETFGQTEMGRDMLAQDYLLKQLSASLVYPEDDLGKSFWTRVYRKAQEKYGTTDIPMNTFNKVWIVPETAVIYEKDSNAILLESHLKVMLEEDYVALRKNSENDVLGLNLANSEERQVISGITSEVVREIVIPEIEKEINEGETFANLRQIYHSMIFATWYKQNLKESLLGQVYVNQNKVKGVELKDPTDNQKIYNQYLEAFKTGVYDYIREDIDPVTADVVPRKYFSGGTALSGLPGIVAKFSIDGNNGQDLSQEYRSQADDLASSSLVMVSSLATESRAELSTQEALVAASSSVDPPDDNEGSENPFASPKVDKRDPNDPFYGTDAHTPTPSDLGKKELHRRSPEKQPFVEMPANTPKDQRTAEEQRLIDDLGLAGWLTQLPQSSTVTGKDNSNVVAGSSEAPDILVKNIGEKDLVQMTTLQLREWGEIVERRGLKFLVFKNYEWAAAYQSSETADWIKETAEAKEFMALTNFTGSSADPRNKYLLAFIKERDLDLSHVFMSNLDENLPPPSYKGEDWTQEKDSYSGQVYRNIYKDLIENHGLKKDNILYFEVKKNMTVDAIKEALNRYEKKFNEVKKKVSVDVVHAGSGQHAHMAFIEAIIDMGQYNLDELRNNFQLLNRKDLSDSIRDSLEFIVKVPEKKNNSEAHEKGVRDIINLLKKHKDLRQDKDFEEYLKSSIRVNAEKYGKSVPDESQWKNFDALVRMVREQMVTIYVDTNEVDIKLIEKDVERILKQEGLPLPFQFQIKTEVAIKNSLNKHVQYNLSTVIANSRDLFREVGVDFNDALTQGVTNNFKRFAEADAVRVLVFGETKVPAVKYMLTGDSMKHAIAELANHNNAVILLDTIAAADSLKTPPQTEDSQDAEVVGKSASTPLGGIDFNSNLLNLKIKRDSNGIPLPMGQQPLENMNIEGFIPVIIDITPMIHMPMLLGLTDRDTDNTNDSTEIQDAFLLNRELERLG